MLCTCFARVVLGVVLVVEVLSELTLALARQEALHAHRLLRVPDAVLVQTLLARAVLEQKRIS